MFFRCFCLLLWLLLTLTARPVAARAKLPLIRANSPGVAIRDGADFRADAWNISPAIRPDVYTVNRCKRSQRVVFYTDLDSIAFTVQPGRTYDFIVLLNGRDSAYTRISGVPVLRMPSRQVRVRPDARGGATADTLPFTFGRNHVIILTGAINGSPPLRLLLDLGANHTVISPSGLAKGANVQFEANSENVAFGGSSTVELSARNTLTVGNLAWDDVPIIKLDDPDEDGIIGHPAFDGKILEIDFDQQLLIVHSALVRPKRRADFRKLPLVFKDDLLFIGGVLTNDGRHYAGDFEFDTGADGSLWLNQAFAQRHHLYNTLKTTGTSRSEGAGHRVVNNTQVLFPELTLAAYALRQVPVAIEQPSAAASYAHNILGMQLLHRFNFVLDFQHDCLYLRPNHFTATPYQ